MAPTIISSKASNWVDRGESPHTTIERVLVRFLKRDPIAHRAWLREQADIVTGMVEADATEVHLAGYLRTLLAEAGDRKCDAATCRLNAIALWHIAKAALVRDFAERVLRGEVPPNEATPDTLSHWLATRLLSADELARYEEQADADDQRE